MNLSNHFTLAELIRSEVAVRHGINNRPTQNHINNLRKLMNEILDPCRELIGKPISITSGYRNQQVNHIVGGAKTSQHTRGLAADFVVPGCQLWPIFTIIGRSTIPFDQLIYETSWLHISTAQSGVPRREILVAKRLNGKWWYTKPNMGASE